MTAPPAERAGAPHGGDGARRPGPLGDGVARDYARKLQRFNAFAEPELRRAIAELDLRRGMRVLDAGCGSGEAVGWLAAQVGDEGAVVGLDLSAAHVVAARAIAPGNAAIVRADLADAPLAAAAFDSIWSVNTLNHLHDPGAAIGRLSAALRPGGRFALGQSALLPEMVFAWDARLESRVNEAVRRYYRERYRIDERALTAVRALLGQMRAAGLQDVRARSWLIERTSPLDAASERYLGETIFRDTWGTRLQPYLHRDDYAELRRLCDPAQPQYALRRRDFHYLQSFTLVLGRAAST
ncbi:class I SAM-dependent methyltransferase [Lysobacter enzymogenes]|uniref:class I SAM-dependent methyltransferase n=1 Tax=Lysobacter enzymogenes TaxID=69 RepID=UPI000898306C|nr:methyltransferase domain-containing protein [Lysobacter enzymogenes]SDW99345.1 Methyltransferase domain-containing protein [Lysobacter enzymogenes]